MKWALAIGLVVIVAGIGVFLRLGTLIASGAVPPVEGAKFQRHE